MVDEEDLAEIEDEILRRNIHTHSTSFFSIRNTELSDLEIANITSYLENPTKNGLWTLKFKWKEDDGISKDLRERLQKN